MEFTPTMLGIKKHLPDAILMHQVDVTEENWDTLPDGITWIQTIENKTRCKSRELWKRISLYAELFGIESAKSRYSEHLNR